MTNRTLAPILLFGLLMTGCGGDADKTISGTYSLSEHPNDADALDTIDFRGDGSCLVDSGERTGIPGTYHTYPDGRLRIEANTGTKTEYSYKYRKLKYTLVLLQDDNSSLYYVLVSGSSHPAFAEIVGIFHTHTDLGDSAGQITLDHTFRNHLLNLMAEDHTYYDIYIDGKCSYTNGVVTYLPEHSNAPQQDKYLRDFIVKRDAKGLWVIDPFHDAVLCETPANNLDLPPPPRGYRNGRQL